MIHVLTCLFATLYLQCARITHGSTRALPAAHARRDVSQPQLGAAPTATRPTGRAVPADAAIDGVKSGLILRQGPLTGRRVLESVAEL